MQHQNQQQSASEAQSLHSLKLGAQNQSLPNPSTPPYHSNKPPSSRGSLSSNQSFSQPQQQHPQSLAHLPSHLSKKKPTSSTHHQKKSEISNFIIKTYRILQDPINANIIHWTDEGNAFIVKNKDRFENEILPKYFKHKKFSSFVRQLNMYDFHKIRKEKQIPIFKHKYFRQGCVELLCKIRRKSGEEGAVGQCDEEEGIQGNEGTKNYIPSLVDFTDKPIVSAYSFKSKSHIPYPSMITSQPSIGLLPGSGAHGSQLELLIQQNTQLTTAISQLTRQQAGLELQRERKRQKIMKVLSVLMNADLRESIIETQGEYNRDGQEYFYTDNGEIQNLRDLQNHFGSDEEPFSFLEYANFMKKIYKNVKDNLFKMQTQNVREDSEEHKIEQQQQ